MATTKKRAYTVPAPTLKLYRNDSVEFEDSPPLLEEMSATPAFSDFIYPDIVSRQACFWGGLVFGFIGAVEYFYPEVVGMQVSKFHSFFYMLAGLSLVIPAITLPPQALARVSVCLGVFFASLGFLGFLVGAPSQISVATPEIVDRFYWILSPGKLEFGTKDHILQEIIGVTLLLVGLRNRQSTPSHLLKMSIK